MTGPDPPSAEHRFLSVMFCDMVDSTGHLFRLDAERFAELLAAYRSAVFARVRRHGGHVARVVGDAVLAYFGWPQAGGRDAQSAVACALEIARDLPRLGAEVPIAVRLAIETGWVLVGDIGPAEGDAADHEQWAVVGPAPHIAARLQERARPNGVIVGSGTTPLLDNRFVTESADTTGLKLPIEISAVHVLNESGHGDPLSRLYARRVPGPPLGRKVELRQLHSAWQRARGGRTEAVLLSGDPGIGKSRLIRALLDAIGLDRPEIIPLFCTAPARGSPFQPWEEPLRRLADLDEAASRDEVRSAIGSLGQRLGLSDDTATGLATLLGAPPADPPPPAAIRRQLLDALRALLESLTHSGALLVLAEDFHWADPSTVELLHEIVAAAAPRPMLLVASHRSDWSPDWAEFPNLSRLSLGPLSETAAHTLADDYARTLAVDLDQTTRAAIVARAEGVPLFIEEFVRALADRDGASSRLPGTVAQLLAARLDTLGDARPLAQIAAVIGREVSIDLLARLAGMQAEKFEDALGRLIASGVMARHGSADNGLLTFQHALLSDAAYQSMQTGRRRALHLRVAEAMSGAPPGVTARHYAAAGENEKAAALFRDAAAAALASGGFVEAEMHAHQSVALIEQCPEERRLAVLLSALNLLGESLIATRGYADPAVQATFERGARLALATDSAFQLLPSLRGLASFYQVRGPLARTQELSKRVLQIARMNGEPLLLAQAERRYAWCRLCQGEIGEARVLLETALERELTAGMSDGALAFDEVATLGILSWVDWLTRGAEAALARAATTAARAELCPRPLSAAYAFGFVAFTHQLVGDTAGTERFAARCRAIAEPRRMVYWTAVADALIGWAAATERRPDAGLPRLRAALAEYRRTQGRILLPYLLCLHADAAHKAGSKLQALEALAEAETVAEAIGARLFLPALLILRGRIQGGSEGAATLHRARALAMDQGANTLVARAMEGLRDRAMGR